MGESIGQSIGGLIQGLIIAHVGGKWAADKGYSGTLWFWAIFLGGVIALYSASLMEDQRLLEASGGARDEARIAQGNALGWIYVRIVTVTSVIILLGLIWLQSQF